jgi:hypothetical protein
VCNTAPSQSSLCFSGIISLSLSNLRGLLLEVGLKLKDVGVDDSDGESDKSIECLSLYAVSIKAGKFTHWFPYPLATKANPEKSVSML